MPESKLAIAVILALALSGCTVAKLPVRAYHFAYCDKMNQDGVHCDRWATPCGRLECK